MSVWNTSNKLVDFISFSIPHHFNKNIFALKPNILQYITMQAEPCHHSMDTGTSVSNRQFSVNMTMLPPLSSTCVNNLQNKFKPVIFVVINI